MADTNDRSPAGSGEGGHESHGESLIDRIKTAFGLRSQPSIREDLADALEGDGNDQDSGFSPEERALLKNILSLRGKRVDDVMVPRADIVAVPLDIPLSDLLTTFQTAGHSRLPVYGETLDDPRGMVHIRDFVAWIASRAAIAARKSRKSKTEPQLALGGIELNTPLGSVKALVRNVLFVPASMPAMDLLAKMQTTRTQLALVIDEYGGTDGLVSMEDIVEIVLGDIEDEHDEDEAQTIVPTGPGVFTADARTDLEDVSRVIGVNVDFDEIEADVDTLGGWLVTLAGRVPVRGEIVPGPGEIEFEILDADPRKVKRVRIHMTGASLARPVPRKGRERKAAAATADESLPETGGEAAPQAASPPAAPDNIPPTSQPDAGEAT